MDDISQASHDETKAAGQNYPSAQAYMETLLDITHDAIIAINAEQYIQLFNSAAQSMFGYSAEDVIGRSLDMLIPPRFRSGHRNLVDHYHGCATQKPRPMGNWRQICGLRSDGREFPIVARISRIIAADCDSLMIVTIKDKTHERDIEKALRKSLEAESRVNEHHLKFAANMAHELRTPLNAIIGFSELFIANPGMFQNEGKSLEYIKFIHQAGESLQSKMMQFIKFSEAESGDREYFREPLNFADICGSVVNSLEPEAKKKGIEISLCNIASHPEANGDGSAVRTILFSIISNAVKFNLPGGKVKIDIATTEDQATISVADTGVGIPAKVLENIGRPFLRGHDAYSSRMDGGVGLGLALSTSLARGMGAHIHIQSEEDIGTTVRIEFPIEAEKASPKACDKRPVI